MPCRILATATTTVPTEPIAADQVRGGTPAAGAVAFDITDIPSGLWEHTAGISTDVEVDEVFVVLDGTARIDIAGQESLEVSPGDVVHLTAGAHTTWHVQTKLRKFWVTKA